MQSICVVGGKGGVGTSVVASNLSWALAERGISILLFDADYGAGATDYLFGVDPLVHLGHYAKEGRDLKDCITRIRPGLEFIGGGGGVPEVSHLQHGKSAEICGALLELASSYDVLVIDSSSGVDLRSLPFQQCADILLQVTSPEPTSLLNSLALFSHVWSTKPEARFAFVCNSVRSVKNGDLMAKHLKSVVGQFLSREVEYWGTLRADRSVSASIARQKVAVESAPRSGFAKDMFELADHVIKELQDLADGVSAEPSESVLKKLKAAKDAPAKEAA